MNEIIKVVQLPVIEERLKEAAPAITERAERLASLACTEDNYKECKRARAELKKEFESLEAQRKAVKEAVTAPYNRFLGVYKEYVETPYKNADKALKERIDGVEGELKKAKEDEAREWFVEYTAANSLDWLKWEDLGITVNMTVTPKKLKEAAQEKADAVKSDIEVIAKHPRAAEVMVEYKKTMKLSESINAVDERHAQMEAEREAAKADQAAQEVKQAAVEKVMEALEPPTEVEEIFEATFTAHGTLKQLKKLKEFMEREDIKYE